MDKEALFALRADTASGQPEDDVEVPGVGTVRVRALSRAEGMLVQQANGTDVTERKILAMGMVNPKLSEVDAGRWQKAATAGEMEPVTQRITELSGLGEGAPKSDVPADADGPGS